MFIVFVFFDFGFVISFGLGGLFLFSVGFVCFFEIINFCVMDISFLFLI